jgi:hypothetical protein
LEYTKQRLPVVHDYSSNQKLNTFNLQACYIKSETQLAALVQLASHVQLASLFMNPGVHSGEAAATLLFDADRNAMMLHG